ncbi:MAG: ATP-binding protein [Ignavibacteria bacterium]|jgi:signal transduction histidine kinase
MDSKERNSEKFILVEKIEELTSRINKLENIDIKNNKKVIAENELSDVEEVELKKRKSGLISSLLVVAVITAVLMTIYEYIKTTLHPEMSIWESHSITIAFATIIAPIGAYFAFRKIEFLGQKAQIELVHRKKAQEALKLANEKLESRVEQRTSQLSEANANLQKEINVRKQAEEEIRKYAEELLISKELLEEKARELTRLNSQLAASEKELKETNISKDKFFSILAHDLRSPFTSLLGLSEFLEKEVPSLSKDELQLFVSGISKSAKGVYNLLENLLDWSRVQTERIDFSPEDFSFGEIVQGVVSLNNSNLVKKKINIKTNVSKEDTVHADKKMTETVMRNLISNAIKFSHFKGTVSIKTERFGADFRVSVEDNGIGIEKENIPKLFKIDQQISKLGTDEEKGTGLGLILCKEFVEKNKGKIWVESEFGKGATFVFTLPLKN